MSVIFWSIFAMLQSNLEDGPIAYEVARAVRVTSDPDRPGITTGLFASYATVKVSSNGIEDIYFLPYYGPDAPMPPSQGLCDFYYVNADLGGFFGDASRPDGSPGKVIVRFRCVVSMD